MLTDPGRNRFVEHGPLTKLNGMMKTVKSALFGRRPRHALLPDGDPLLRMGTQSSPSSRNCCAVLPKRRGSSQTKRGPGGLPRSAGLKHFSSRPWKPWQAGLAIGLLAVFTLAFLRLPRGGTIRSASPTASFIFKNSLRTTISFMSSVPRPPRLVAPRTLPQAQKITWWLVLVVAGLFMGGAGRRGPVRKNST
ncbi:MAG: hypothetical protein MZV63_26095 [Marinilabiliales bacterium]|nr:hypothetical protein [Marinilabiliales bacterium]